MDTHGPELSFARHVIDIAPSIELRGISTEVKSQVHTHLVNTYQLRSIDCDHLLLGISSMCGGDKDELPNDPEILRMWVRDVLSHHDIQMPQWERDAAISHVPEIRRIASVKDAIRDVLRDSMTEGAVISHEYVAPFLAEKADVVIHLRMWRECDSPPIIPPDYDESVAVVPYEVSVDDECDLSSVIEAVECALSKYLEKVNRPENEKSPQHASKSKSEAYVR